MKSTIKEVVLGAGLCFISFHFTESGMQTLGAEPGCRREWHHRRRGPSAGTAAPETAAAPSRMRRGEPVSEGAAGRR